MCTDVSDWFIICTGHAHVYTHAYIVASHIRFLLVDACIRIHEYVLYIV